jgi:hypothetical protein
MQFRIWESFKPGDGLDKMERTEESRHNMGVPLPGMVDHFGPDLYKLPDDRVYRRVMLWFKNAGLRIMGAGCKVDLPCTKTVGGQICTSYSLPTS